MEILIKRSARRKKTIQARMVDGVMEVMAPEDIPEGELQEHISRLKARMEKKTTRRDDAKLEERARHLNRKYFQGKLAWKGISYSTRQMKRNGSCNISERTISISYRLMDMPRWVEDYVIVHELAHLVEPNHGRRFKSLVMRYPLAERARGYLIAMDRMARKGS